MTRTPRKPRAEIVPLSRRDKIELGGYYAAGYLHGLGVPLAVALARTMGKPLVALRRRSGHLIHAGVRTGIREFRDVRGALSEEKFIAPYVNVGPLEILEISEQDLLREAPASEEMVERAHRHLAELFDDLPITKEKNQRLTSFLEELGSLCREHGYWLRGQTSSGIVLYEAYGEEAGYRATHVPGGTMRLDRILDDEEPGEAINLDRRPS